LAKVNRNTVIKHLENLGEEELRHEILTLYKKFKQVKEYYQSDLALEDNKLFESYKRKIFKAYNPSSGPGRRKLSNSRKLINEYKKIAIFQHEIIELILYRVECGVNYALKNPQQNRAFFSAHVSSFNEAHILLLRNGMLADYDKKAHDLIAASKGLPFGFKDDLAAILK